MPEFDFDQLFGDNYYYSMSNYSLLSSPNARRTRYGNSLRWSQVNGVAAFRS
jgi:hypothetical protein